jgi:hypothetical protein
MGKKKRKKKVGKEFLMRSLWKAQRKLNLICNNEKKALM